MFFPFYFQYNIAVPKRPEDNSSDIHSEDTHNTQVLKENFKLKKRTKKQKIEHTATSPPSSTSSSPPHSPSSSSLASESPPSVHASSSKEEESAEVGTKLCFV
jgi:hypothetical protein